VADAAVRRRAWRASPAPQLRVPLLDWPVKTNQIPRHVPPAPLAANPLLLFLAAGVLPFGTMFIELYFAMTRQAAGTDRGVAEGGAPARCTGAARPAVCARALPRGRLSTHVCAAPALVRSLWLGYFYYLFGFVLLIGVLTCIINAEISVLCTYVQLCAEDYHWW
jgi:transmembrane 9 superfamily protein 2/4